MLPSRPLLPDFSDPVKQSRYKPSGKYASSDVISLWTRSLIAGLLGGVILFVLRNVTVAAGNVLVSIYESQESEVLTVAAQSLLLVAAAFIAFVIGGVGGTQYMPKIIRRTSCRNSGKVAQSGILFGIAIYAALESMNFVFGNPFSTVSGLAELAMGSGNGYTESATVLIFVAIEALLIIGMASLFSAQFIETTPYCEDCNQWHTASSRDTASNTVQVDMQTAKAIHTAIEDDVTPTTFSRVNDTLPHLSLRETHCPNCNKTVIYGKLQWKEPYIENGQAKSRTAGEDWIEGFTVSSEVGTSLQNWIKHNHPDPVRTRQGNVGNLIASSKPKADEPSQVPASPTGQIEIKNSYGMGGGFPLLVDHEPNLNLIFTDPDPVWPQNPDTKNYADWRTADIQTKRMVLAIAYLQHPNPDVRRSTLPFLHDIPAARVSEVLYDRLMVEPSADLRQAIAEHIWVREAAVNCKYAVNAFKDEMSISRDSLRREAAQSSLDLLAKHAPDQDARQAMEAGG